MAYDDTNHSVREIHASNLACAAGASFAKFAMFKAALLKRVTAVIGTAGTNAAAAINVMVSSNTLASLTIGTTAAGSMLDSGDLNVAIPAQSFLDIQGAANSGSAVVSLNIEYEYDPATT